MISDPAAAQLGLLIEYAMDMYSRPGGQETLEPAPDPRLSPNWKICGYICGTDALFRLHSSIQLDADTVFYGFLAQSTAKPDDFVAVIRGTDGIVEWIEDAQFVPIPDSAGGHVEQGFWQVYQSLKLRMAGTMQDIVSGLEKAVGSGKLTVIGHSLGSALGTYLTLDLAGSTHLKQNVEACLFASPQTGDGTFVSRFANTVGKYKLFNYVLDVVPWVPRGLGYETLPGATWITPFDAQARIRCNVLCNHHILSYCAMLDYRLLDWDAVRIEDKRCAACIRN